MFYVKGAIMTYFHNYHRSHILRVIWFEIDCSHILKVTWFEIDNIYLSLAIV